MSGYTLEVKEPTAVNKPTLESDCEVIADVDFFNSYLRARHHIELMDAADKMARMQAEQVFQAAWVGEVRGGFVPDKNDLYTQSRLMNALGEGINSYRDMEKVGDLLRHALRILDEAARLHADLLGEANENISTIRGTR
jgi:hypothetical protein